MISLATLEEILQLDMVQSSVKKIDLFVSQKTKYSKEYMKAIAYKGKILHELGKTNDALKLLYEYIPSIKAMDNESVIALTSSIIDITLSIGIYDQAAKYIRIKREYLPISRTSEYIKDTTRLYLAKKDYENAKEALIEYLDDDITKEEEIDALEKLANIYFEERNYDKYLECIPKLESYYTTILDLTHQEELFKNRIEIAYIKKNHIQVILDSQRFFQEFDADSDKKLSVASYMIRSYLAVSDYKKAAIIESNYEEYISKDNLDASLEFCYAAIDLYNKTNTASSVMEYHRRIDELEAIKNKDKEEIKEKKPKAKKAKEIIIPEIETEIELPKPVKLDEVTYSNLGILNPKEEELPIQTQKVIEDIKSFKNIEVSENFERLTAVFDSLNQIESHVKFRECFRRACIEITKQYHVEELYLLYFDNEYKGLHYKVERAYDKKPTIELLEGTLEYQAMLMEQETFLDKGDLTYSKDIVTGKMYEDDIYAFSVPLVDSITSIGSLTFISHKDFITEDLCYEGLKLITKVVNQRLLEAIEYEEEGIKNQRLAFIASNMSSGLKENLEGYYHFSNQAMEMLGVLETLTEADYLMHLNTTDAAKYKEVMKEIYAIMTPNLELEYDFKKDNDIIRIKERFYPVLRNGMIEVYSLLDDVTDYAKERKNLVDLAYLNPISGMQTIVKLTSDLVKEYPKKKLSLAIVDVIDSKLYKELYGINFYNQIIKAVGMKLTKAFEKSFTTDLYHIEGTTYAILIRDINDRRIIDSLLTQALNKSIHEMFELNHRVKIHFNAGVYRLSKNTNLKDVSEIIYYANDALIDAANMIDLDNHIAHYDSKLAKERFMENSLVTSISEAIDFGHLSLMYKQIVNMENASVLGFYLSISMDNYEVDEEEMFKVVKRKGMLAQIEKYIIGTAFKELKMFKNETKASLNLFIPIGKETMEERFNEFIVKQQSFYKIDPKFITLVCDSIYNTPVALLKDMGYHLASRDIFDCYRGLCDYLIYDYHGVNKESIPEILEICKKHNVICILSHMDTKDDIDMARNSGYRFLIGDYYKKRVRMKDLLQSVRRKIQNTEEGF